VQDSKPRIVIAQINSTVGDLQGNAKKISQTILKAKEFGADMVVFPELVLTGYPPEDLLLKPQFVQG
jgi:NAD+ synthase (glutamine-hydrolysing)